MYYDQYTNPFASSVRHRRKPGHPLHPTPVWPSSSSTYTGSSPGWTDGAGDGRSWYEISDSPGCPCLVILMKEIWE